MFLSDQGERKAVRISMIDNDGYEAGQRDATLDDFSRAYIPYGGSINDGFYKDNTHSEAFTTHPGSLGDTTRVIYSSDGSTTGKLSLSPTGMTAAMTQAAQYTVASLGTVYMSDAGLSAGFYKVSTNGFTIPQNVSGSSALVYSAADNIDGKLFYFSMPAHTDAAIFEKSRLADNVDMISGSKLSLTDDAILPKLAVKGNG